MDAAQAVASLSLRNRDEVGDFSEQIQQKRSCLKKFFASFLQKRSASLPAVQSILDAQVPI
jgi:hypothetical protein